MAGQPIIAANAPTANPTETIAQGSSPQLAVADPRVRDLAEVLASLHDQAKNIRTPTALASDLLAEALLQRRYGASSSPFGGSVAAGDEGGSRAPPSGGFAAWLPPAGGEPSGIPSPSPGVPPPSAPAGTASAVPAASPAAGAAMAAAYGQGDPRQPLAAPSPRFAPPPPDVLNDARAAIRKGADPAKVRTRLVAHGYDPRAL